MMQVVSHQFTGNHLDREVDAELEFIRTKLAVRLQKKPVAAGAQISGQFIAACGAYHLGRTNDALELLNTCCDGAGALFAGIAAPANTTVTFPFRGATLAGPSGPPGFGAGPGPWATALLLAQALRRKEVVDIVLAVPVSVLSAAPGERDACFAHLAYTLQAFFGDEDFNEPLAEFERLSRPENLTVSTPLGVESFRSIAPVLVAIAAQDQKGFSEALVNLLEAHKLAFGRGKEAASPAGLIDCHAAGLVALAEERGLHLEVQSGYIPPWLTTAGVP
jgi:hypothetical protein